jgi:SAM-dependent methyltransferase
MKDIKKYTKANRLAWNKVMPLHQKANQNKWDDAFSNPGYVALKDKELELLTSIGVSGKNIAHPCCNNGIELMSLKNLGADQCVGFDISDIAIKEATGRSIKFGINCQFVQTDVYEIPEHFYGIFDLVYISIGCFGWLPDLKQFFKKVALLLNGTGKLFIYEMHPFTAMLSEDDNKDADPLKIIEPYFKKEPYVENGGIDYIGKTTYESQIQYWFVWTLSDIIMGIIDNNMRISHFTEYREDISAVHKRNMDSGIDIPLSYIIVADKIITSKYT